ncbi:MAG: hypothetical protein H6760_00695 [Candidatus Nomurabacteria bacterium]|nr:MAG: hypothetical protein H6760_00695 [Candidatus Nomurabacteria bacterium]
MVTFEDFYEYHDVERLSVEEVQKAEVLAAIRDALTHAWYQTQPGKAHSVLSFIDQKFSTIPKSTLPEEIKTLLFQIQCIVEFSSLPSTSPEEVQEYMQKKSRVPLFIEELELQDIMPRLIQVHLGFPDLFLRWFGSAVQGLRAGEQEIGNSRIQLFNGKVSSPTIGSWTQDYERFAENHPADGDVVIAEYMTKSPNIRSLEDSDKAAIRKLFTWFNLLSIDQSPILRVSEASRPRVSPSSVSKIPDTLTQEPDNDVLAPVAPQKSMGKIKPVQSAAQEKPERDVSPQELLLTNLHNSSNLVERFERLEKDLPPAGPKSIMQLTALAEKALAGQEKSGRVIAGIFQIVRARGLQALLSDASFVNLMRKTMAPELEQRLRLTHDQAVQVSDSPANRMVILKEFFKALFNTATGSEADAARLMVHVASIVPETMAGPEAGFAYFDMSDQHFHWSLTEVRSADGVLRNRIP